MFREDVVLQWLERLENAGLECDGMSRALSTLFQRDGIGHMVFTGSLVVAGVGKIAPHWWIELADGRICDMRARMWLGIDARVPHGLFSPGEGVTYHVERERELHHVRMSASIFHILTGLKMTQFSLASER